MDRTKWPYPHAFIQCDDYNKCNYKPVSFDTKIDWIISSSYFIKSANKLPKLITFEAILLGNIILVSSHPYSYGEFGIRCDKLGINMWLDTNDPEDALYLAEEIIKNRLKHYVEYNLGILSEIQGVDVTNKYLKYLTSAYDA